MNCRINSIRALLNAIVLVCTAWPGFAHADFDSALADLTGASFKKKEQAIAELYRSGNERSAAVLQALLDGSLYTRTADQRVVIATKTDAAYALRDALSGDDLGSAPEASVERIKTNNKLRKALRGAVAGLRLSSSDVEVRIAAAEELLGTPSQASIELLREALSRETDARASDAMRLGLATIDIKSDSAEARLAAIEDLSGSVRQEVLALLRSVAEGSDEPQAEVRQAATEALERVELRVALYHQVENLFFGISLGSVLLLAAVGLAITFGVMGVINMAHGEMVMLGAYTTYVIQTMMPDSIDFSLFIAIPVAFLFTALVGIIIERGVIRLLYGRPLETLLATFGISLILQQAVRSVFSPLNRSVATPSWMSGSLELNPALSLTYNRLYIIVFAVLVLVALALLLRNSRLGLEIRAVTQNRDMARAMGIRTARVDALTFGLGSGIAGMAGVALSQLTNVGPNMGQAYIVDSFMVVVFGGVGNLLGTFFGAMTLGIANKFLEPVTGAVLAKILVLVFIIVFIQRRPRGLFALSGRAAET